MGRIHLEDVVDSREVDASGNDVSSEQEAGLLLIEGVECVDPLLLLHESVDLGK